MSIPKVVTTITCEMDLRCELFSMGAIPVRLVLFFFFFPSCVFVTLTLHLFRCSVIDAILVFCESGTTRS